jgi:hypothetical protein
VWLAKQHLMLRQQQILFGLVCAAGRATPDAASATLIVLVSVSGWLAKEHLMLRQQHILLVYVWLAEQHLMLTQQHILFGLVCMAGQATFVAATATHIVWVSVCGWLSNT